MSYVDNVRFDSLERKLKLITGSLDKRIESDHAQLADIADGTGIDDGALTPAKMSFVEKTVNLFDFSTVVPSAKLKSSFGVSGYNDYDAASGYSISGEAYAVTPGETITLSWRTVTSNEFNIFGYDANGKYYGKYLSTINTDGVTTSFVVPNYIRYIRIQQRDTGTAFSQYFMMVKCTASNFPAGYVPHGDQLSGLYSPTPNKSVTESHLSDGVSDKLLYTSTDLDAPSYIDLVVGETPYIYTHGLLNSNDVDALKKYQVVTNDGQPIDRHAISGVRYKSLAGFTAGNYANKWDLIDSVTGATKKSKNFSIRLFNVPSNPATAKNILMFGDSLMGTGYITQYFRGILDGYGLTNYKLVGRVTWAPGGAERFEANGGYSWHNYVDDPAILPAAFPYNYLWNAVSGQIDIHNYMTQYCSGGNLDYVVCEIGWNHLVNAVYATDTMAQIGTMVRSFLTQLHTEYPNCKVLLCGLQRAPVRDCVNANPKAKLAQWAFYSALNAEYSAIAADAAFSGFVRFLQTGMFFDSEHGHSVAAYNYNPYTSEQAGAYYSLNNCVTDYIHPNSEIGYRMWAQAIWQSFVAMTNMA